jgi:hypothetical protein
VRSGVMEDTAAHLAFFRKLALYGLPVGIGLGLLTSFIAMSHTPGDRLRRLGHRARPRHAGNLPACLGYVGLVVTMLHSRTACRASACWRRRAHGAHQLPDAVADLHDLLLRFRLGTGACRAPSRCCSCRGVCRAESRSATGGWRASATARWSGCGADSRIGRCRRCARPALRGGPTQTA